MDSLRGSSIIHTIDSSTNNDGLTDDSLLNFPVCKQILRSTSALG